MIYTQEVENMCPVAQGVHHGAAPVPTEGKWVQNKEVKNISGFTRKRDLTYMWYILRFRQALFLFCRKGIRKR